MGRGYVHAFSLSLCGEREKAEQLGKEEWEKGLPRERRKRSCMVEGKSLEWRDE
jgi:hypothetical protein